MNVIAWENQQLPRRWSSYRGWAAESLEEACEKLQERFPWWQPENVVVVHNQYWFPTDVNRWDEINEE